MNTMLDALKNAGFESSVKTSEMFSFDDAKFPYFVDSSFAPSIGYVELKAANYIENHRTVLTQSDIKNMKVLDKHDPLYCWVLSNRELCFKAERPKSNYRLTSSAERFGKHVKFDSDDYEEVMRYGFTCLAYYIKYSGYDRSMHIECSHSLEYTIKHSVFSDEVSESVKNELSNIYGWLSYGYDEDKDKVISILDLLSRAGKFVPIVIDTDYVVSKNRYCYRFSSAPKRSTLGANILDDAHCMSDLKEWLDQGGKINPRVFYFVNESKNGDWYLKRDTNKSPRL